MEHRSSIPHYLNILLAVSSRVWSIVVQFPTTSISCWRSRQEYGASQFNSPLPQYLVGGLVKSMEHRSSIPHYLNILLAVSSRVWSIVVQFPTTSISCWRYRQEYGASQFNSPLPQYLVGGLVKSMEHRSSIPHYLNILLAVSSRVWSIVVQFPTTSISCWRSRQEYGASQFNSQLPQYLVGGLVKSMEHRSSIHNYLNILLAVSSRVWSIVVQFTTTSISCWRSRQEYGASQFNSQLPQYLVGGLVKSMEHRSSIHNYHNILLAVSSRDDIINSQLPQYLVGGLVKSMEHRSSIPHYLNILLAVSSRVWSIVVQFTTTSISCWRSRQEYGASQFNSQLPQYLVGGLVKSMEHRSSIHNYLNMLLGVSSRVWSIVVQFTTTSISCWRSRQEYGASQFNSQLPQYLVGGLVKSMEHRSSIHNYLNILLAVSSRVWSIVVQFTTTSISCWRSRQEYGASQFNSQLPQYLVGGLVKRRHNQFTTTTISCWRSRQEYGASQFNSPLPQYLVGGLVKSMEHRSSIHNYLNILLAVSSRVWSIVVQFTTTSISCWRSRQEYGASQFNSQLPQYLVGGLVKSMEHRSSIHNYLNILLAVSSRVWSIVVQFTTTSISCWRSRQEYGASQFNSQLPQYLVGGLVKSMEHRSSIHNYLNILLAVSSRVWSIVVQFTTTSISCWRSRQEYGASQFNSQLPQYLVGGLVKGMEHRSSIHNYLNILLAVSSRVWSIVVQFPTTTISCWRSRQEYGASQFNSPSAKTNCCIICIWCFSAKHEAVGGVVIEWQFDLQLPM